LLSYPLNPHCESQDQSRISSRIHNYQQIPIPKSKMTPSSFPDRDLFPRDHVSPDQDVSTLNCDTLSAIRELDKMMAETINAVFKCSLFRHFTLLFFAC